MLKKSVIFFIATCLLMLAADYAHSVYLKDVGQQVEGRQLTNKKMWTKILRDMPARQIKDILGEPERAVEGVTTIWFYQKGGSVEFSNGKVIKWIKPYSWDY